MFFVLFFVAYLDHSVFNFARAVVLAWIIVTPSLVFVLKFVINSKSRSTSHGRTVVLVLGDGYSFNEFELAQLQRHNICLHTIINYDGAVIKEKIEVVVTRFLVINLDKAAQPGLIKELTHLDLKGVHLLAPSSFYGEFFT